MLLIVFFMMTMIISWLETQGKVDNLSDFRKIINCRLFLNTVKLTTIAASVIRELKQIDAAAERWRSTSKFLFKKNQGQVNSVGPWH